MTDAFEQIRSLPVARGDAGARGDAAVCTLRGCSCGASTSLLTLPNAITLVRTLGCLVLGMWGLAIGSSTLLLVGLGVYWVGDMADGAVARLTDRETRFGGAFDIVCDRVCCATFYIGWGALHTDLIVAVAVYLASFMAVDTLLSMSFLHWPLRSVNYFDVVDRATYRWNFSPIAKGLNSAAFFVALVLLANVWIATAVAAIALIVKSVSLVRVQRLLAQRTPECLSAYGETVAV